VPASITADQLDPEARAELRTLPGDLAEAVARQLIAASLAEDPEQAYQHAQAARQLAARVGVVRESVGVAAYRAGHWAEALSELRAARRLTGRSTYLPMMADSERALGRLDRALDLANGKEAADADRATRIELKIVESGIRRDQGLPGAAVVALQIPELTDGRHRRGSARLYYAYADALLDAGREDEAREWFSRAAGADSQGETDADERFDELDQLAIDDLQAGDDDDADDAEDLDLGDYADDLDEDGDADEEDDENQDLEDLSDEDEDEDGAVDLDEGGEDDDGEDDDGEDDDLDADDLDADEEDDEDLDGLGGDADDGDSNEGNADDLDADDSDEDDLDADDEDLDDEDDDGESDEDDADTSDGDDEDEDSGNGEVQPGASP
jgi:hypothetical protein